jgi:alkyldihydroxyacetonephosphate synthase
MKVSTSEIIVNNRGTISHQHGVGKDHAPYLPREKGELAMNMLKTLCQSVDEKGVLNPGTLFVDEK